MKKYSLLVVIVLILSISFSNTVAAKGKKTLNNISKKATSEKTAESSLVVPFDINIEKLPANYKGTDITKLYSLLVKKAPLRKKEFETTVDYEKKIKSAVSDNVYAFRLDCFSKKDIEGSRYGAGGYVDYNADAQKLNIHISNDNHYFIKYLFEERRTTIVVKEIDKGSRSYKGSNAFGASRLVESFSSTLYLVAFAFDGLAIDSRLNIKIDMLPDKAKHLINNIGVLLLCKTSLHKVPAGSTGNDLIFEDNYYIKATIDSPTSVSEDLKYINVEALAIWIYDLRTGEIVFKEQM